jgi:hypothetical protein
MPRPAPRRPFPRRAGAPEPCDAANWPSAPRRAAPRACPASSIRRLCLPWSWRLIAAPAESGKHGTRLSGPRTANSAHRMESSASGIRRNCYPSTLPALCGSFTRPYTARLQAPARSSRPQLRGRASPWPATLRKPPQNGHLLHCARSDFIPLQFLFTHCRFLASRW